MIRFIDVSTAQGKIDWPAVQASGIGAVWVKASEGVTRSPRRDAYFKAAVEGARAAGLPVGAYHFARLGDVAKEMQRFMFSTKVVGELELPYWLDVEPSSRLGGWKFKGFERQYSLREIIRWVAEWAAVLPGGCLYGYRSMLDKSTKWALPLVVATRPWGDTGTPPADPLPQQPVIPWVGWQYASEMGRCPGVDGPVDLGLWRGL